jgi:hypothetical protein
LIKIKANFDLPEGEVNPKTIFKHLLNVAPQGEVVTQGGEISEGEENFFEILLGLQTAKSILEERIQIKLFTPSEDPSAPYSLPTGRP